MLSLCEAYLIVLFFLIIPRVTNFRLYDGIGSKFHVLQYPLGFPKHA